MVLKFFLQMLLYFLVIFVFFSIASFINMLFTLTFRLLMKMFNRIRADTDPCGSAWHFISSWNIVFHGYSLDCFSQFLSTSHYAYFDLSWMHKISSDTTSNILPPPPKKRKIPPHLKSLMSSLLSISFCSSVKNCRREWASAICAACWSWFHLLIY